MIGRVSNHSEFAVGCSFNVFAKNVVATGGWDEKVCVWHWQPQLPMTTPNFNNMSQITPQIKTNTAPITQPQ